MTHPRFQNPWWLVAGSALALSVSCGTLLLFTFGALLKPVTTEMGWSRQIMSAAFGVATATCALGMPLAGKLVDRFGARTVALWGVTVFAACFAAIGLTTASPLVFIALYALAGFAGATHTPIPYARAIAGRIDARLGLALGAAMAGIGVGQMLLPHLMQPVIAAVGWRTTYAVLGALVFGIAFPSVLLLIRGEGTGGRKSRLAGSTANKLPGLGVRQALTSAPFWLIACAVFLTGSGLVGTIAHLPALLTDRGFSGAFAALLLSCVGLSAMLGRLLYGHLLDRFHAPYVGAVSFLLPVAGASLLLAGASEPALLFAAFALGQALGAEADMVGYLVRRYFGMHRFGELSGYMLAVFALGSGLGPLLMGRCFDRTHSYDLALMGFMAAFTMSAFLISRIGPYAFPASHTTHR